MNFISRANKAINYILNPLNIEISKRNESISIRVLKQLYENLILEVQGYYNEFKSPNYIINVERNRLLQKLLGTGITEAMNIVDCVQKADNLNGDICEFGIAQGATSALLANEIIKNNKTLWLFDSFKGLPQPTEKDILIDDIFNLGKIEKYAGKMAVGVESVIERLSEIDFPLSRVNIVAGFIEDTIKNRKMPEMVSFAYIDFDFYFPTKIALEYLDKVLCQGGNIIVDDYGYFSTGVKMAVDEFISMAKTDYSITISKEYEGHFVIIKKNINKK